MGQKILNAILGTVIGIMIIASCKSNELIANKSGGQLWGENCTRCHYAPSPSDLSDQQWDLVTTHMMVRANLTEIEKQKIIEFLQAAN